MPLDRAIAFLRDVGLDIQVTPKQHRQAFVPGVWLRPHGLAINQRVATIADVLHEAGHVVMVPSSFRHLLQVGTIPGRRLTNAILRHQRTHSPFDEQGHQTLLERAFAQMDECEAVAWSFAAAVHLGIKPNELIAKRPDGTRPFGRKSEAEVVLAQVSSGHYPGVHGLHAVGMCNRREWPRMLRWSVG